LRERNVLWHMLKHKRKKSMGNKRGNVRMYNVRIRHVYTATVATEKQLLLLNIMSVSEFLLQLVVGIQIASLLCCIILSSAACLNHILNAWKAQLLGEGEHKMWCFDLFHNFCLKLWSF
jgi:hypothetical protein